MQKLTKAGEIVNDEWQILTAEQAQQSDGARQVILPLEDYLALDAPGSEIGVVLQSEDDPGRLRDSVAQLAVIAIDFPKFMDGRGFSIARMLRDDLGYQGELRAVGHFIPDQLHYMLRCGFDAFSLAEDGNVETARACLKDFSQHYQAGVGERRQRFRASA